MNQVISPVVIGQMLRSPRFVFSGHWPLVSYSSNLMPHNSCRKSAGQWVHPRRTQRKNLSLPERISSSVVQGRPCGCLCPGRSLPKGAPPPDWPGGYEGQAGYSTEVLAKASALCRDGSPTCVVVKPWGEETRGTRSWQAEGLWIAVQQAVSADGIQRLRALHPMLNADAR